jgi:glycine/D-amino acid oxidase-like deaminating enzyme
MSLAQDFVQKPWWWQDRDEYDGGVHAALPATADVVVIGGGVTGLEAARALADGGRDVVVLEAGRIGNGASSRNAGQIGRNFKNAYSKMKEMWGPDAARGVFDELQEAYDAVEALGLVYGDRIGWRESGRIIGAMSASLAEKLHREYQLRAEDLGEKLDILSRDQIREEMQSDLYHGGVRLPHNGAIQPALYTDVLAERAKSAGASIREHVSVEGVRREGKTFAVRTPHGQITARNVIVATNGYSGNAIPAIKARLLPITSFMIATEPMSSNRMSKVLASAATYHDNRRRSHYFTVADGGRRILMGGRTGTIHRSTLGTLRRLAEDIRFIFPELGDVAITHGWSGRCAAPMDLFPRFGELDGMHYALGYSFSGMAMGPHLARKVAQMILTPDAPPHSYFAREQFKPFPIITRSSLSTALITQWYAEADRPGGMKRRI